MAAMGFSRACGAVVNQELSREQIELVLKKDRTPLGREVTFHPEPAHGYGYAAFGVAAEKMPSSQTTDEWVHHLALVQGKDGQWHINLPRPPIQTSDIGATALAVQALKTYPLAGRTGEFAMRIDRARKWLSKVKPLNQEERVFQLLGLHWAGEPATRLQKLARGLLAEQREDGGWAQLPKLESDAYATGQALFALHEAAGIRAGNAQFARGVEYLNSTQADDGTWFVARRAFPFQPTMRSGYSYNRDGWISAAGSSWATMALSLAVVDLQVQSPLLSAKTRQ
jgi:hypothetical protein